MSDVTINLTKLHWARARPHRSSGKAFGSVASVSYSTNYGAHRMPMFIMTLHDPKLLDLFGDKRVHIDYTVDSGRTLLRLHANDAGEFCINTLRKRTTTILRTSALPFNMTDAKPSTRIGSDNVLIDEAQHEAVFVLPVGFTIDETVVPKPSKEEPVKNKSSLFESEQSSEPPEEETVEVSTATPPLITPSDPEVEQTEEESAPESEASAINIAPIVKQALKQYSKKFPALAGFIGAHEDRAEYVINLKDKEVKLLDNLVRVPKGLLISRLQSLHREDFLTEADVRDKLAEFSDDFEDIKGVRLTIKRDTLAFRC